MDVRLSFPLFLIFNITHEEDKTLYKSGDKGKILGQKLSVLSGDISVSKRHFPRSIRCGEKCVCVCVCVCVCARAR
jgi:hypothetical protein